MTERRFGHIALAGAPNVGKSSLLNQLVGVHLSMVSPRAQATRLPVVGLRTDDDTQYVVHDLPGLLEPSYLMQARMRDAALETLRQVHVVLHLHPAPDGPAPPFHELVGPDMPLDMPILTVYTKGDLVPAETQAVLAERGTVVSAATGAGIDEMLARVREYLPPGEFAYDPDDVGTQPLRFFVVEYLREAAFEFLGEEVPYSFNAEVEEFRESTRPVYIRVTLFVERETQKAIVIGKGGQTIKALGGHARARLEALMGAPVYLDCWVKVLPRWRRDPAALTRFGFPVSNHDKESV